MSCKLLIGIYSILAGVSYLSVEYREIGRG